MKNRRHIGRWLLLAVLLVGFIVPGVPWVKSVAAQSPVSLTVYDPTGAFEVTQTFAKRVSDLNGKTICEVTDDDWQASRTFPVIRELLQKQFPTAKIVPFNDIPKLIVGQDIPNLEDAVKKEGCQAVIVGNAA